MPLADEIDFRLQNTELAVRIDDAKHESKFGIKEMILRSEWDLLQKHIADQLSSPSHAIDDSNPCGPGINTKNPGSSGAQGPGVPHPTRRFVARGLGPFDLLS